MSMVLEIRPDLKAQLDCLAVETHRSEAELVNEALETYLQYTHGYIAGLKQRVADADAGHFAPDQEVMDFFNQHGGAD